MKKIIVTADDYGMSRAVNDAIDAGIEAGLITTTNVMVNMPYYKEAKKLKYNKSISVGIHFTLSCGNPVSAPETIKTLVNSDGKFYKYPEFRQRYRKHLIKDEDIITELKAQYKLYEELMGEPDYWNTHQNVHVDFGIFRLFVDVAKELGIKRMRTHKRIYVPATKDEGKQSLVWRMIEPFKSSLLKIWQRNALKKGITSPDGLIVCLNNDDTNNLEYTFNNIKWNKNMVGEYVIHPATENDSPYFGKIVEQRVREYEMFTSEDTKRIIKEASIELTNYNREF